MRFFHILLLALCVASVFVNGKDAPPQSIQADTIGYAEDVFQQHRHLSNQEDDTEVPSSSPVYIQTCDTEHDHANPCCVGSKSKKMHVKLIMKSLFIQEPAMVIKHVRMQVQG